MNTACDPNCYQPSKASETIASQIGICREAKWYGERKKMWKKKLHGYMYMEEVHGYPDQVTEHS